MGRKFGRVNIFSGEGREMIGWLSHDAAEQGPVELLV